MGPADVVLKDRPAVVPRERGAVAARRSAALDTWTAYLPLALVAASLALYLKTAAPGAYSFDAAEFTIAAATWGIPHATGYPLFLLIGRLFQTALSVGDVAYRMVVATALFAALTVGTLFLILREVRIGLAASLLATGAFAVSYYQWGSAVVTKEHSLHDWLLTLTLWLLLRWRHKGFGWLAAATAVYSLSLTNHLSAALYGPLLAGYVVWRVRRHEVLLTPRQLACVLGIAILGLAPYLYIPLAYMAHPAFDIAGQFDADGIYHPVNLASWQGMLWMLSGRQFAGAIFGSGWGELPGQVWQLAAWWWGNFFGIGVVLGFAGLMPFWRAQRPFFWLTLGLGAVHAAFFVTYAVPDRYNMFVPLYLLWTIPLAFGIQWVAHQLDSSAGITIVYGLLACGLVVGAVGNYRLLDLSSDHRPSEWAKNLLARTPQNAVVLTRWAFSGPLRYEQLIDGLRPDVEVIDSFLISREDLAHFVQANLDSRPLIIDDPNLFTSPEGYQNVCASQLPGTTVALEPSVSDQPGAHFEGFQLVRCNRLSSS